MKTSQTIEKFKNFEDIGCREGYIQKYIADDLAAATEHSLEIFAEKGIDLIDACKTLGISRARFYTILKEKRTMLVEKYVVLCDILLETSIHEFLFNVTPEFLMPKKDRMFLKCIQRFTSEELQNFISRMPAKINRSEMLDAEYIKKLTYTRLMELCDDRGIAPSNLLDFKEAPLRKKFKEWVVRKEYPGNIQTLIYFSLCFDMPIDYFLIQDYSNRCNLYLYNDSGNKIYLNQAEKRILSNFVCLSPEQQDDLLSDLLVDNICSK